MAGLAGVVVGGVLGASLRHEHSTTQPGSLIPAGAFETLGTVGLVCALLVAGVILVVPRSTRAGGGMTLLLAAGLVGGLIVGLALGPTEPPSRVGPGGITQEPRASAMRAQGYVTLHGAITATELHVDGDCDAARDLPVGSLVVLAPWPDGSDALIRLTPGRDSSAITIDLAHGTVRETATAATTVTERRGEAGSVTSRSMSGSFDLSIGRVVVDAEWVCPDEDPKSEQATTGRV